MTPDLPAVILVSPGPIDGYPPVQYQAKILASSGCRVELITCSLPAKSGVVAFSAEGVRVSIVPEQLSFVRRTFALTAALARARRRLRRAQTIEVCFDPVGVFISDLTPWKGSRRIAHFHELAGLDEGPYGRRLRSALGRFEEVVVPGAERATLTKELLGLDRLPTNIPNYPIDDGIRPRPSHPTRGFEVVYCGSLGFHQRLDKVIETVPDWPSGTSLLLIGSTHGSDAQALRRMVTERRLGDRVSFAGWLDLTRAEARMARAHLGIAFLDSSYPQWSSALEASNKRFQYMKMGLPQLGDDNPGVIDLVEGLGVGACLRADDFKRLPSLISAYLEDEGMRREQGHQARQLFEARFNYASAFRPVMERWFAHR
ncbi:hypothetical protein N9F93_00480 [bacterium]|nr:hypothetical protein [bacterium]